jgi:hypothetical protein
MLCFPMDASSRAPTFRLGPPPYHQAGKSLLGMAFHIEATAQQHAPAPEPIYYCATGQELPAFEPCKDRKDERNI